MQDCAKKLIVNLNKKLMPIQNNPSSTIRTKIAISNIQSSLISILSPHHANNLITAIIHPEHSPDGNIKHHTRASDSLITRRAYLTSCICSYISNCFEKRKNLTKSASTFRPLNEPLSDCLTNLDHETV